MVTKIVPRQDKKMLAILQSKITISGPNLPLYDSQGMLRDCAYCDHVHKLDGFCTKCARVGGAIDYFKPCQVTTTIGDYIRSLNDNDLAEFLSFIDSKEFLSEITKKLNK